MRRKFAGHVDIAIFRPEIKGPHGHCDPYALAGGVYSPLLRQGQGLARPYQRPGVPAGLQFGVRVAVFETAAAAAFALAGRVAVLRSAAVGKVLRP